MHTDGSTNCALLGPVDCDSFYKWIPLSRWPGCHLIRGIAFYLLCIFYQSFLHYIFITLRLVCSSPSKWRSRLLGGGLYHQGKFGCNDVREQHGRSHSPSEAVTDMRTYAQVSTAFLLFLFCINTFFKQ